MMLHYALKRRTTKETDKGDGAVCLRPRVQGRFFFMKRQQFCSGMSESRYLSTLTYCM